MPSVFLPHFSLETRLRKLVIALFKNLKIKLNMFTQKAKPFKFIEFEQLPRVPALALTPSQMDIMRKQGQSISTQNYDNMYYDGTVNNSFDLPIDQVRGVDISDVWAASKDSGKRLRKSSVTVKADHAV